MAQKITPGLEIAIVKMIKQGMRHQDIARSAGGISIWTVSRIASKHGASRTVGRPRKRSN